MAEATGGQGGASGGGDSGAVVAPWGADAAATWTIGEGEGAKAWYDFLPDGDVKATIAAKKPANPAVLAQSYHELQRTASHANDENTLIIPSADAPDEDWVNFYTKWGRPESVEGYSDVQWGDKADPTMVEFGKKVAYETGMNPAQAQRMAEMWNEFAGMQAQAAEGATAEANAAAVNALKADWKGDWNADMAAGGRVLEALKASGGLTEDDFIAIESAIGLAPVVKFVATLGKMTGEHGFVAPTGGQGGMDPATMTPEQAVAEVTRLNADPEFQKAYTDAKHAGHQTAVERMAALYAKAGNKLQI